MKKEPKIKQCLRLDKNVIAVGWKIANFDNRSFSNVIETLILKEAEKRGLFIQT